MALPSLVSLALLLAPACRPTPCEIGYQLAADGTCIPTSSIDDTADGPPPDEPPANVECDVEEDEVLDVTVEVGDVPTVARVTFTSATAGLGRVAWTDGTSWYESPSEPLPSTQHERLVLGVPELTELRVWAVNQAGDDTWCGLAQDVKTHALPDYLPTPTLGDVDPSGLLPGYLVTSIQHTSGADAVVIDKATGGIIWAWAAGATVPRVRPASAGGSFHVFIDNPGPDVLDTLQNVSLYGSPGRSLSVDFHTDFLELPDGTFAGLTWTFASFDGDTRFLLGDGIQEYGPDGMPRLVWNVFEWVAPDLADTWEKGRCASRPEYEDWSHATDLAYDEAEDAYYVTLLHFDSVMKVERSTGRLVWTMSPILGDWTFPGSAGQDLVSRPLGVASAQTDTLVVYNLNEAETGESPLIHWLQVDEVDHSARSLRVYPVDSMSNDDTASFTILENGSLLLTQPMDGRILEVTGTLDPVFAVELEDAFRFGRTTHLDGLY